MKTARKAILLALCVILLVVSAVMGTLAYLTADDAVTNTFTVGKITMTLDEAKTDEYGVVDTTATARVDTNQYKLIPGHTYTKDPTVHMGEDSESAWVFVQVENGIAALEKEDATIHGQITSTEYGWQQLKDENNNDVAGVYYKAWTKGTERNLPVFGNFTIDGDKVVNGTTTDSTKVSIDGYATEKDNAGKPTGTNLIKVTAYAIQMDGFNSTENAEVLNAWYAWDALSDQLGLR